ncbi:protein Pry2p [Diutina catenulata]
MLSSAVLLSLVAAVHAQAVITVTAPKEVVTVTSVETTTVSVTLSDTPPAAGATSQSLPSEESPVDVPSAATDTPSTQPAVPSSIGQASSSVFGTTITYTPSAANTQPTSEPAPPPSEAAPSSEFATTITFRPSPTTSEAPAPTSDTPTQPPASSKPPAPTTSEAPAPTTSEAPAPTTSQGPAPGPSLSKFEQDTLDTHNEKRRLHGVQDLSWDPKLVEYAKNYAESGIVDCNTMKLIHSHGPYGENLAGGYVGGVDPVVAWYDEISLYDYSNPGFSEATGHFTALVWKSTSKVGCYAKMCNTKWRQYTICSYSDEVGNVVGVDRKTGKTYFEENVLPPL